MRIFWDTSAIVANIFVEPHSREAEMILARHTLAHAWSWLRVEAHAALARRQATPEQWRKLGNLLEAVAWTDLGETVHDDLCEFNASLRLRASDAAHLFCFSLLVPHLPDLVLVSFDDEMRRAARRLRLPVWIRRGRG